jgi:glutamate synthase domain-containing protein 3
MLKPSTFDLAHSTVRDLNAALQSLRPDTNERQWHVLNPRGLHALAVGLDAPVEVTIEGNVGYYCAGMNQRARVIVRGNAGPGVAENMMSGEVRVEGDAGQSAGATGRGGLLVIGGNAGARCGISMKGIDIVVRGRVGHMSAFMAQRGHLVVCGDAGDNLGDSIYEAKLFVAGRVNRLGADCEEKEITDDDRRALAGLLAAAEFPDAPDPGSFRLFGSARRLYHFHVDNASAY